jgi:pilus assembly protein TadC
VWLQVLFAFGLVLQIGLTIAMGLLVGRWVGSFLDQHLTGGMVFTLIGMLLGLIGSFITVYQLLKRSFLDEGGDD